MAHSEPRAAPRAASRLVVDGEGHVEDLLGWLAAMSSPTPGTRICDRDHGGQRPVCAHVWPSRLAATSTRSPTSTSATTDTERDSALGNEALAIGHDQQSLVQPPAIRSSTAPDCIEPSPIQFTQDATANVSLLLPRAQCSKR
jgi:hypothetical protein